jgi:hypothetical protein
VDVSYFPDGAEMVLVETAKKLAGMVGGVSTGGGSDWTPEERASMARESMRGMGMEDGN